jgi:protein O-GlcNAc transferase
MAKIDIRKSLEIALQHHGAGRLRDAEVLYRQILVQQPKHADATHLLGVIAHQSGRNDVAVDLIRQAITLRPNFPEAYCNLGNALNNLGQFDPAIAAFRQAIAINPNFSDAHFNLGNALSRKGRPDEAIAAYRQAIALRPNFPEAYSNFGNALKDMGKLDEAIIAHHQAVALNPNLALAQNNLGVALNSKGQLDDAIAAYRHAIRLKPDYAEAHRNLGNSLMGQGLLDEAIAACRQAITVAPDNAAIHSNLLYALHFHPAYDAKAIAEEHRAWNHRHAEPLRKSIPAYPINPAPDRQLRIGYVSPDFREHPVGRFILPLLAAHNRDRFSVFCYADMQRSDRFTELLRGYAAQWRNIAGLSDEHAAQLIREDQIDILVDLTMHMANNHMLLFARKPAPIQVTYLAYCSTTGLETMDYRLTDPHLDPPAMNDEFYTEESIRLPETYWCYYPLEDQGPEIGPLPAMMRREVTFGSQNNFCKVSVGALDVWIKLLHAIPKSRLILHAHDGSHRQRVRDLLLRRGIDADRLEFVGRVPLLDYLNLYQTIDLALDPFPYNGGTTTCDALWMGVPVVTLAAPTAVGRGGVSVLRNVGLPELIAQTPQQYLQIATDLANDPPRLAELRRTLRPRMRLSPLMNAPRFAAAVEAEYQKMWRNFIDH